MPFFCSRAFMLRWTTLLSSSGGFMPGPRPVVDALGVGSTADAVVGLAEVVGDRPAGIAGLGDRSPGQRREGEAKGGEGQGFHLNLSARRSPAPPGRERDWACARRAS